MREIDSSATIARTLPAVIVSWMTVTIWPGSNSPRISDSRSSFSRITSGMPSTLTRIVRLRVTLCEPSAPPSIISGSFHPRKGGGFGASGGGGGGATTG